MNIKAYIKKHGLSQGDFANKVGVSQSMVSQWLTGRRGVSAKRAVIIERRTQGEITREDLLPRIFRKLNGDGAAAT